MLLSTTLGNMLTWKIDLMKERNVKGTQNKECLPVQYQTWEFPFLPLQNLKKDVYTCLVPVGC